MTYRQVITRLKKMASPKNVAGMARFGINSKGTFGISIPHLRRLAREIGRDHDLARQLWASGFHEARILAGFVADPARVTEALAERWVHDFDSWDVCDQVAALFELTLFARKKIREWAAADREFVKRAAFAMMAGLAVHDKAAGGRQFEHFLRVIARASNRPAKLRQESRQLGPAKHREAEQTVEPEGYCRGEGDRADRLPRRQVDRRRCAAGIDESGRPATAPGPVKEPSPPFRNRYT